MSKLTTPQAINQLSTARVELASQRLAPWLAYLRQVRAQRGVAVLPPTAQG